MNKIEFDEYLRLQAVSHWNNIVKKLREKKEKEKPKQLIETMPQKENNFILWSDKESYEEWNKRIDIEIEDLKKANRFDWSLINYLYQNFYLSK